MEKKETAEKAVREIRRKTRRLQRRAGWWEDSQDLRLTAWCVQRRRWSATLEVSRNDER